MSNDQTPAVVPKPKLYDEIVNKRSLYGKLVGREVIPCSRDEFIKNFESNKVKQEMVGDVKVSTIFLGINHNHFGGEPIWFETMMFGGKHDQECIRTRTIDEAEMVHAKCVELLKEEGAIDVRPIREQIE